MNIQEEKRVCFDVDQNKQKINYLLKKNKENETQQTELNQKLATAQSDINSLSSAVETLQNSIGGQTESFEECFPKSYDIMRWNTNCNRNNKAVNGPFFFCCKEFSQVKLKFKFTLENQTTATSTTLELSIDDKTFYSDTHTWDGTTTTYDYEIEHTFTSKERGHMLMILATTPASVNTNITKVVVIKSIIMEIWGTNVEILSHRPDFQVFSAPTKVLMTTQVFDSLPRYSMQTPDENLSFDQSNFKTFRADYWFQNNPIPCITSAFNDDGTLVYSDFPTFASPFFSKYSAMPMLEVSIDITDDQTGMQTRDASFIGTTLCGDFALTNLTNATRPNRVSCEHNGLIWVNYERESYNQNIIDRPTTQVYDITGSQRLANTSNTAPECYVVCNVDGTAYIVMMKFDITNTKYPKTDLGFGSNPKVYILPDNKIEVFLKYGKNTKRVLLERDSENPKQINLLSTEILPNIQGCWKCFNGAHFERVGDEIRFFPANATTHTKTLQLFY